MILEVLDDLEADDQLELVVFEIERPQVSGLKANRVGHPGCHRLEHCARDFDADHLARAAGGQQPAVVAGAAAGIQDQTAPSRLRRPPVPGDVLDLDQPPLVLFRDEALRDSVPG